MKETKWDDRPWGPSNGLYDNKILNIILQAFKFIYEGILILLGVPPDIFSTHHRVPLQWMHTS